ncbi:MAG: ribulose-phosphate 3-epimerase [Nanoarchaeota archaeon]
MIKIIPTLFTLSQKEFNLQIKNLTFANTIHIDFMDGQFTQNKSISFKDMEDLTKLKNINLEVHVMGYEPLKYMSYFKKYNFKKIYIHYEVFETDSEMQYEIFELKNKGFKVGIAINPSTNVEDIIHYFDMIDSIMLMSVWPGMQGQNFINKTYNKIEKIEENNFKGTVTIDGGINETNIKKLAKQNIDTLYIGSYISQSNNPKQNYEKLKSLISKK